jgi:DNA-binding FadR family transcriptional regulator
VRRSIACRSAAHHFLESDLVLSYDDWVEIQTAHRAVVDALARDIFAGRYRPGASLPTEPELCVAFAVSRTTVREALKTLTAKGIVTVRPKTGTRVLPFDRWSLLDPEVVAWRLAAGVDDAFVHDLVDIRLIIEPEAAARAANRAEPDDVAALSEAYAFMDRAAHGDGSYIQADLDFHCTLLRSAHNQFLSQLIPALTGMLRFSFGLSVTSMDNAIAALPLHRAILTGIAAHRPAAARAATRHLIEQARDDIEARPEGMASALMHASPISPLSSFETRPAGASRDEGPKTNPHGAAAAKRPSRTMRPSTRTRPNAKAKARAR